jgi:hypothetical protein
VDDGLLGVKLDFILQVYIFHQIFNHVFIDLVRLALFRMAPILPMQHLFHSSHSNYNYKARISQPTGLRLS